MPSGRDTRPHGASYIDVVLFESTGTGSGGNIGPVLSTLSKRKTPKRRIASVTVPDSREPAVLPRIEGGEASGAETLGDGKGLASVFGEESVDVPARLVREPRLSYPVSAPREGVESDVGVTLVVNSDGKVIEANIIRPAGNGFDEAAMNAARNLIFSR